VKLFEHKDFEQAILGAEKHFSGRRLRPAVIEKDYYVTEVLLVSYSVRQSLRGLLRNSARIVGSPLTSG
jgi:hypothetical protein